MGLFSSGLIFGRSFVHRILGLIFGCAYFWVCLFSGGLIICKLRYMVFYLNENKYRCASSGMDLRKAQCHDNRVPGLRLRDTIRVPGILGTRLRDTILSLIVSLLCPKFQGLSGTRFQGHESCPLSCPLIVSLRDTNRVQNFRGTNQGHESGTRHESCP